MNSLCKYLYSCSISDILELCEELGVCLTFAPPNDKGEYRIVVNTNNLYRTLYFDKDTPNHDYTDQILKVLEDFKIMDKEKKDEKVH